MDEPVPLFEVHIHPSLSAIAAALNLHSKNNFQLDLRPLQLTITDLPLGLLDVFRAITMELCSEYADVKVLSSDHSIDIVPKETSKNNILRSYLGEGDLKFLCFGDSGGFAGNDYELLTAEFGISVLNVSSSFDTCWNFAPIGVNKVKALRYYLEALEMYDRQLVMLKQKL
jgi:hydroxymethylpyrimidine pyrophosphatase-like HAD family hydrolase